MASSLSPMKRSFRQRLIDNQGSFHSVPQVNGVCSSHVEENITKMAAPKTCSRKFLERELRQRCREFLLVVVVFRKWRWLKLSTYMRLWAGTRKLGLNRSMWLRHWLQEYTMFGSCSVDGDIMWTSFRQVTAMIGLGSLGSIITGRDYLQILWWVPGIYNLAEINFISDVILGIPSPRQEGDSARMRHLLVSLAITGFPCRWYLNHTGSLAVWGVWLAKINDPRAFHRNECR